MVLGGNRPGRCVPISRHEAPVTRSCDLGANRTDLALLEFAVHQDVRQSVWVLLSVLSALYRPCCGHDLPVRRDSATPR
jgi:hypothetical protein